MIVWGLDYKGLEDWLFVCRDASIFAAKIAIGKGYVANACHWFSLWL